MFKGTFWFIITNLVQHLCNKLTLVVYQATHKQESACIIDLHKSKVISGLDLTIMYSIVLIFTHKRLTYMSYLQTCVCQQTFEKKSAYNLKVTYFAGCNQWVCPDCGTHAKDFHVFEKFHKKLSVKNLTYMQKNWLWLSFQHIKLYAFW